MSETPSRPKLAPAVLAALVEAAPKRVIKKLDRDPTVAEGWSWSEREDGVAVESAGGETVQVRAPAQALEDLHCTCLLAPRCYHLLAVARALPIEEAPREPAAPAADESAPEPDSFDASERRELSSAQRECNARAIESAARFLEGGASAAGAVRQAELLRLVHDARALGLHRLSNAALRVVQGTRSLAVQTSDFRLAHLALATEELLRITHRLDRGHATLAELGTARRRYATIGSLRLRGVFTEPVLTASGYAGAVTWLIDDDGRLYTVPGILPGDAARALAAYEEPVAVGDVSMTYGELGRAGLFMQRATASADGRLGSGKAVEAVRAGPSSWDDGAIAERFEEPLASQLDRAFARLGSAEPQRGADLLFMRGVVTAVDGDALLIATEASAVRASAPLRHDSLGFRSSLRRLSRAPGLALRLIGRLDPMRPREVAALAVGPSRDDEGSFRLPRSWARRVDLGFQRLLGAHLSVDEPAPRGVWSAERGVDPTEPTRRRRERMVLGGRGSIPPAALAEVARDAALLERRMMPALAAATRALAVRASERDRTISGARDGGDARALARTWLATAEVERAARRHLARAAWR